MGITRVFGEQYRKPTGLFGSLIGRQMVGHHVPLVDWALEAIPVGPADSVLDIGCGAGMAVERLSKIATDATVVGIDYSGTMVDMAKKRNRSAIRAGKVEVREGTVSSIPYEDGRFAKAWSIESFYYWPDPVADLREVWRVLGPGGGMVIVLEWFRDMVGIERIEPLAERMNCPLFSGAEIVALLGEAGFRDAAFGLRQKPAMLLAKGFRD